MTEKTTLNGYEFVTDSIEYGQVYFYRYVNGHKTNEYIRLALTADKELCAYDLNNIGQYEGVSAFSFDEVNAEKMIRAQLREYYQNEKYAIQSMKVVVKILPTGQMAYEYWVETSTRKEHVSDDGSKLFLLSGETFCFIIPTE